ncbi:MAG: methyltransferase domain-containing protein [Candidatus Brocadiales bacterium]|nr:methyltransferase domain-containing protein [Candidatus Brocadiales bacterium]
MGRLAIVFSLLVVLTLLSIKLYVKEGDKEAFWDSWARDWEEAIQGDTDEMDRMIKAIPLFELREGETVLDAGCGTGTLIPFLLKEVGRGGRVYGLDISQEMLRIARQKHYDGDVSFLKGDIIEIPLPSESMDRIICFRTFSIIDDKIGVLREFFRVLKPSGVVVICNLLGSKEETVLLKEIGGAIANDTSPGVKEMEQFFLESNFTPVELLDSDTLYIMKARKPLQ